MMNKFQSPPVPSVPEVSLVFEKPQDAKSFDYNSRRSPSMDKYNSYATWKQNAILSGNATPKPRHSVGSPLERCHSQSDANQLHKNVISNESLRHSRSDPSLTRKIDAQSTMHGYERNSPLQVAPRENLQRSNSQGHNGQVEDSFRYSEAYRDEERQKNGLRLDERHAMRLTNPNARPQQGNFDPKYSSQDPNSKKMGTNQFANSPNRSQPDYPNPNFHPGSPGSQHFHPNMFPRYHQFPPYCDTDYGYPYPHPYSPNIQSQRSENEETVKNLLQLINNQSEQIKSLQSQVERLLKIQEESMKDREKCNCSRNLGMVNENYEQNTQFSIQTTNNNPTHSPANVQRHNGTVERNMMGSTNIKEMKKNVACDYNDGRINSSTRDEQLKNKILEQKVSIGVMTSFEFTVQNNPFAPESEDHRPYYGQTQPAVDEIRGVGGNERVSEHDVSRTSQNVFSRVSNLPLENIIEDSESHLSLSQQPSSNFHSSPTIDEFKSSEPASRKIGKNPSMGKSPESNPTVFNTKNSEDATETGRDNYFSHQIRQIQDIQEQQFRNPQRSQSPKNFDNVSRQTPGHADCRRQDNDQNFNPRTENRNVFTPIPQKLAPNETRRYNQRESDSPYRFQDQQNSKTPGGRDATTGNGYKNADVLALEPRAQQSPVAYLKERNGILLSRDNNCIEESMVLNSGELEINERPPPSPEPSIHVEMQEYSSDEESDKHGGEVDKQTPKVGWTFYNNVLGQVNQILQNSPIARNLKDKTTEKENVMEDMKNKATADRTVKMATMEQLRQLGISFVENNDPKDGIDTSNKK